MLRDSDNVFHCPDERPPPRQSTVALPPTSSSTQQVHFTPSTLTYCTRAFASVFRGIEQAPAASSSMGPDPYPPRYSNLERRGKEEA